MRIFVLEGINAAGKTLAGKVIKNAIHQLGAQCLVVDPAAYGPIGKLLRERIVDPNFRENADLDAVLFSALRAEGAQHILSDLACDSSVNIVLERWSLALAAYGRADGTRPQLVSELRAVLNSLLPVDLTFLLDIHGSTALERLASNPKKNRFELRGAEYLESVSQAYRELASVEANTFIIDALASPIQVCEQMRAVLSAVYPQFGDLRFDRIAADTEQLDLGL
jgi:dTMP kinase